MNLTDSVTAAIWTPAGRGAVALVRVSGELSKHFSSSESVFPFQSVNRQDTWKLPLNRITFGHWGSPETTREDVVVCRIAESLIEIHCHGGTAAVSRVMSDLTTAGVIEVPWQAQFRSQTPEPDFESTLQAEMLLQLPHCTTLTTAKFLLAQPKAWQRLRQKLRLDAESQSWAQGRTCVDQILQRIALGRHLCSPFQVVLTGRPNVGKSALMNAIVGFQRSVVFDRPGTTRDAVTSETAIAGWPVQFVDTAGIRDTVDDLELQGIAIAVEHLHQADLILEVIDATQEKVELELTAPEDRLATRQTEFSVRVTSTPVQEAPPRLVVQNKIDLLQEPPRSVSNRSDRVPVSAINHTGIKVLLQRIADILVFEPLSLEEVIPFSSRQVEELNALRTAFDLHDGEQLGALLGNA